MPLSASLGLAALCLLSCATARSPSGFTYAIGANALAQIYEYPFPLCPELGTVKDTTVEPVMAGAWLDKLGVTDPPKRITTHEGPATPQPRLVQESRGSGVLEPLAVTIKAAGGAAGAFTGKLIICLVTLGWRCNG